MLSTARVSPARLRFMEGLLRCLREGGFSANMTHHAYHALDSHIAGFTLWVVNIMTNTDDLNATAASFVETLSIEEYPYMVEHIHQHLNPPDDEEGSEFEFGLNLILDGLERMRDRP